MTTMATVRINTTQQMILYRDFIIQEAMAKDFTTVWEWTHEDYGRGLYLHATGDCQTIFECIDAVDEWHDQSGALPSASLSASQKEQA